MYKSSTDKNINKLVNMYLKLGWRIRKSKKHDVLIAPNQRRLAIPASPSDKRRAYLNFSHDVRRILSTS
ncbi:phosphoribosylglycinamide formyltransferase [Kingella oralis]|jgi:hypothetical protein|uniref:phosphoribosylglycinamide formyltransferase n=1 Tax=Kingella oralis TaxID=505 RepID=UPI0034E5ACB7